MALKSVFIAYFSQEYRKTYFLQFSASHLLVMLRSTMKSQVTKHLLYDHILTFYCFPSWYFLCHYLFSHFRPIYTETERVRLSQFSVPFHLRGTAIGITWFTENDS